MNELKHLFAGATDDIDPVDQRQAVADDVRRGRAALGRRRAAWGGGVLTVALVVGGAATLTHTAGAPAPPSGGGVVIAGDPVPTAGAPTVATSSRVRVVAYTDRQPEGYRVKSVPQGWVVLQSDVDHLLIGPKDAKDAFYTGKLLVALESDDAEPSSGKRVDLGGGRTGRLVEDEGDDGNGGLFFRTSDGRLAVVQYPAALGWTEDDVVQFAKGVEVLPAATTSNG